MNPIFMYTAVDPQYYTPQEYLELEELAETKNDYIGGRIFPVAGSTTNHNEICLNFCSNFKSQMKGKNYKIYMGDIKLWIPRHRIYTYPDVMVIQGIPQYEGNGTSIVTNPLVILEVLSKSTENYDRNHKFRYYRSIPELKEYLIVDQYEYLIEQFVKNLEGQWVLTEIESLENTLSLQSVEFQLPLYNFYEGVTL